MRRMEVSILLGKSRPQFSRLAIYLSCNPPLVTAPGLEPRQTESKSVMLTITSYGIINEQIARFELASQSWQGRTLTIVLYLHLGGYPVLPLGYDSKTSVHGP